MQALDDAPASSVLDICFEHLREPLGVRSLALFVADYGERQLHPLVPTSAPAPPDVETMSIGGTVAGKSFLSGEIITAENHHGPVAWVPVGRRGNWLGVLHVRLSEALDARRLRALRSLGIMVGGTLSGAKRHSDVYEAARGVHEMRLAAAMQYDLLPLPAYADSVVEIAGRLEPAYDVAGDGFDFARNERDLSLAVFDAMGHALRATLLTALAVGAYRLHRRRGSPLPEIAEEIDRAVVNGGHGEGFVTGHLCRLDLDTGQMDWLHVGHPLPFVVRNHAAREVGGPEPMLPFGLGGRPRTPRRVALEPGDTLVFFSDGIVEARPPGGDPYGEDRLRDLIARHSDRQISLHTMTRTVLDDVLDHAQGELRDDATLVAVRWWGPEGVAGAPETSPA